MDRKKENSIVQTALSLVVGLGALTVTALLLYAIATSSGAEQSREIAESKLGVVERFFMNSTNAVKDAASITGNVPKHYWISSDTEIPPEPSRDGFGKTEDPGQLEPVIQAAQPLLDGQSLLFTTETPIAPQTQVHYYRDETILAITWKQAIQGTAYTFSEIKIADPSQIRRYLSGGSYGSGKLAIPTEMASSVNAVVATSGDYYQFRNAGVIVYNGAICRAESGADTCYVDEKGDLHFTYMRDQMNLEKAQKFVEENQIRFSVAFGPVLVENGEKVAFGSYGLGEVGGNFARAAICQMGELHYLLVNANAEENMSVYPTMYSFADQIYATGCQQAYALDGGQTATLIMDGELVNQMTKGFQRKISDIIYFATALPDG